MLMILSSNLRIARLGHQPGASKVVPSVVPYPSIYFSAACSFSALKG